jgi:excisionase family DNA binding protein
MKVTVNAMLLKPNEAGEILGFSRSKIYALLAEGSLPHIRAGRSVRIPRASLESWITANTIPGEIRRSA